MLKELTNVECFLYYTYQNTFLKKSKNLFLPLLALAKRKVNAKVRNFFESPKLFFSFFSNQFLFQLTCAPVFPKADAKVCIIFEPPKLFSLFFPKFFTGNTHEKTFHIVSSVVTYCYRETPVLFTAIQLLFSNPPYLPYILSTVTKSQVTIKPQKSRFRIALYLY